MSEWYAVGEVTETVIILRRRFFQEVAVNTRAIEAVHDRADGYHLVMTSGHVYQVRRSALHDQQLRMVLGLPT